MHISPIVPVQGNPLNLRLASDIRRIRKEYGMNRFLLCGPDAAKAHVAGLTVRDYEIFAEELLNLKKEFAGTDIEIGWWCAPTLNNGTNLPFQHIVNVDGTVSPRGLCPLDPAWRREFVRRILIVAGKARPNIIQMEDDYELSNHPGVKFGCFCPLHLAEFARRTGKNFSREALVEIYRENRPETLQLRKNFAEMSRDSLCLLASEIRAGLDKTVPETRISVCEPGTTDKDGFLSEAEPRAFAGKNTRPLIRVYGSPYSSQNISRDIPGYLAHAMYTLEHLPPDIETMHESDTYPHTRFFMSADYLQALIYGAVACGAQGTLFYGTQYLDDPLEDDAYFRTYKKHASKLNAFADAVHGSSLTGVRCIHTPELVSAKPLSGWVFPLVDAASILSQFGIPYSTRNGTPAFLMGGTAEVLSGAEIRSLLSSPVVMDSEAAQILTARGYSELLGCEAVPMRECRFTNEKLSDLPEFRHIRGRLIYNFAAMPSGLESRYSPYAELKLSGAEELSCYTDSCGNHMHPAAVRYRNELGGRIVIFASGFMNNKTSNLYSWRKKEMFRILLEWLADKPLPAVVTSRPGVWLLVNESPERTVFSFMDMNGDDDRPLSVRFSPVYAGKKFKELGMDGIWHPCKISFHGRDAEISSPWPRLEFRIFAVEK